MNPALLLALWCSAFSTLLTGHWFIHKKHTEAMKKEVLDFEYAWKKGVIHAKK